MAWDGSASEVDGQPDELAHFYLQRVDQPACVWRLSRSALEAMLAATHSLAPTPVAVRGSSASTRTLQTNTRGHALAITRDGDQASAGDSARGV